MRYSLRDENNNIVATFTSKKAYSEYLNDLRLRNALDWSVGSTFVTRQPEKGTFKLTHTKSGKEVTF